MEFLQESTETIAAFFHISDYSSTMGTVLYLLIPIVHPFLVFLMTFFAMVEPLLTVLAPTAKALATKDLRSCILMWCFNVVLVASTCI